MRPGSGCDFDPAEHPRYFFNPLRRCESLDRGSGGYAIRNFSYPKMVISLASHLGQVGHTQDLPLLAQIPQSTAYDFGDAATYAGIDFVKN
jgi:hypothetical protein